MIGARVGSRVGLRVGVGVGAGSDVFVDSQPPARVAKGTITSGNGQVTPNMPTHAAGDILLLVYETQGGTTALNTANGFQAVTNSPQNCTSGTLLTALHVYWHRATSAAMSAPIIAAPTNHTVAQVFSIRGCTASGNPWDTTRGDVTTADDTAVSIAGDTTTIPNCLIVLLCSHGIDSASAQFTGITNSSLSSLSEWEDGGAVDGNGGGFLVATGIKEAPGSVSTTTATLGSASGQGRLMIALKP